jgi:hypothetical protein
VLDGGDEGADEELHYVDVAQDLEQNPEGPKANLASEGKPRIINTIFPNYAIMFCYDCAFTFQELN